MNDFKQTSKYLTGNVTVSGTFTAAFDLSAETLREWRERDEIMAALLYAFIAVPTKARAPSKRTLVATAVSGLYGHE